MFEVVYEKKSKGVYEAMIHAGQGKQQARILLGKIERDLVETEVGPVSAFRFTPHGHVAAVGAEITRRTLKDAKHWIENQLTAALVKGESHIRPAGVA